MKVRLAVAAAVLALGVSAFTPTPTAAQGPSGVLICGMPPRGPSVLIEFGPKFGPESVGDAARLCINFFGGIPGRVTIDR